MTRDEIYEAFLAQVPYELYPMQEEALLAWFSSEQGVLVSAPTGMGKTLIAEAVVYEALCTGRRAYYTTPLIALTDQKFHELQVKAAQWGFDPNDVGLVTGNRKINPDAKILVVVAEILFNRLLQPESAAAESSALNFDDVDAVVMDEFHQFNDPERGIVWEFSLRLLPPRIRTLLLSDTVGNAKQFAIWLETRHHRKLEVVESDERKVPLMFQWDEEHFLEDFVEEMALGDDETRRTPALLFCFSRDLCWDYAEILKGKKLISAEQQAGLLAELQSEKMTDGIGPKLKTMLLRGVGVHHAGVMPKYRRIVERCFQKKLLAVCACTETLSEGINLPARSVVLPSLLKGPKGKKKLVPFGTAHQIFGRAGRPQFDTQGYVFALAHPDDVKIARWQKKYDQIPENTPDPNLQKAKKQLKKKQPKRSPEEQYWSEKQFQILQNAKAENLHSVGQIPWRLLAFMLQASPDVQQLRKLVQDRLLDSGRMERGQRDLDQ
ncbi:MAG: DEAD/DEAH box helicase, partial [Thermoguttaceae bacterium]|nr:DEAD/DEAH box helicase [Thermoguttaceae bacterium]